MEDSKRRRRLLQHILMGWVAVTGAMPLTALADTDSLAIREPVFHAPAEAAPTEAAPAETAPRAAAEPVGTFSRSLLAVREPTAAATFRPIREPQVSTAASRPAIGQPASRPPRARIAAASAPRLAPPATVALPPLPGADDSSGANDLSGTAASSDHARWLRKRSLARQVSSEILGAPASRPVVPPSPNVSTMTSRRLAQQAAEQLSQARRQSARGTLLSARRSAFETLRLIADANDLLIGNVTSATALQQARTALRESEDFAGRFGPVGPEAISRMVASHQTTILKGCDTSQLNGSRATDLYLDFARSQLADVAEANPIAIEALVVLAEVERQTETPGPLSDAMVISLLRAAIQAGPNDPVVANELGFQLLKQGLLEEAQWALEHSYRLHPSRSAGVNLAETLRQRGDQASAQAMIARLDQIPSAPARQPQVFALTPQQFAALSQPTAPPQSQQVSQNHRFAHNQPVPRAAMPAAGAAVGGPAAAVASPPAAAPLAPTPAAPVQPAEPKSPLGRVADAVSHFWK